MVRRARRDEDYYEGAPPRARRRSGNEVLWFMLGGAGLVGLIFIFIVMGSSGGEGNKREAQQALDKFLKALFTNKYRGTLDKIHLEGVLVEYNPGALKNRGQWTPKEKQSIELSLYNSLRDRLKRDVQIEAEIDIRRKVFDRAEVTWDSYQDWVQFRWTTDAYETVLSERRHTWPSKVMLARLMEFDGRWLVVHFGTEK